MSAAPLTPPQAPPDDDDFRLSEATTPAVPRLALRRDHVLPIFIVASLIVHATIVLPSLFAADDQKPEPRKEIPVELVQLPPPKPVETPKPAPKPAGKPEPKSAPQKTAEKRAEPKPPAPQKVADKPAPKARAEKPQHAEQQRQVKPQQEKPQQVAKREAPKTERAKAPDPVKAPDPPKPVASGTERLRQLLGPIPGMEAQALPGASDTGTETVSYTQLVLSQVAKAKKEGKFHGMPGAASVAFKVGDDGQALDVELRRPSGDPTLDDEAVAMIHRAAPFPKPPPGGRRDYTITLVFKTV